MKFPSNLCIGIVLTYSSLSFAQSGVSQGKTQTPQCICVVNGSNHYKTSFAPQTTIEETNNVIMILTMMVLARKTVTKKVKKETVVKNKKLNQLFQHVNSMNYQMY